MAMQRAAPASPVCRLLWAEQSRAPGMQTHASHESPVLIKKMNPHLLISVFLKIGYSIFSFFIHF